MNSATPILHASTGLCGDTTGPSQWRVSSALVVQLNSVSGTAAARRERRCAASRARTCIHRPYPHTRGAAHPWACCSAVVRVDAVAHMRAAGWWLWWGFGKLTWSDKAPPLVAHQGPCGFLWRGRGPAAPGQARQPLNVFACARLRLPPWDFSGYEPKENTGTVPSFPKQTWCCKARSEKLYSYFFLMGMVVGPPLLW